MRLPDCFSHSLGKEPYFAINAPPHILHWIPLVLLFCLNREPKFDHEVFGFFTVQREGLESGFGGSHIVKLEGDFQPFRRIMGSSSNALEQPTEFSNYLRCNDDLFCRCLEAI